MAIETSYRKENMWDGAKVTRRAASYDDLWELTHNKIPRKENMKHLAATKVEKKSKNVKLDIVCSDGTWIDAEHFERESKVVQAGYKNDFGFIEVESNSEIIHKVELFCAIRTRIENCCPPNNIYDDYGIHLLQLKLNVFNYKFLQRNKIYALDLMIAAFDLEIKSLIDLMMKDVDDMFTKMTSDDEVYEFLYVNLNGDYNFDKYEFEDLVYNLVGFEWAFKMTRTLHAQVFPSAKKWDPELLKVPFHQYKTLSYEQRVYIPELVSSYSKTGSNNGNFRVTIVCLDGISFEGKPFERESRRVQCCYDNHGALIEVESNSQIIHKVEFFCVVRALIQDDYAHDEHLLQHKLNSFNSKFRQLNRIHVLDLMNVAFCLQIKSLVDVMMEDIDEMFCKMTSEEEAYKILFINMKAENKPRKKEWMKNRPARYKWPWCLRKATLGKQLMTELGLLT
ncbi:uncharacterized protein [Rutidosis leptorrhynchoides]|uniref:uncharacterized protein n=1 Tax=Rutidosis leptorrhynchoides TaxID=125765 RepID=UPI003A99F5D7